ncbi:MAG: DUF4286 family protein [Sphingobacterium sp.]
MYLYNVSLIIEGSNHQDLLSWTQQLITEKAYSVRLLKMLDSPHEGHTYCLQAESNSQEEIDQLRSSLMKDLQEHINQHHREKAFLFESVMQYLSSSAPLG